MGPDLMSTPVRLRCGRPLSLDADTRCGGLAARRNVLLGLWAARKLGLPRDQHEAYAWSVHFADFDAPGDADVIGKVARDFAEARVPITERELRHHLREMELKAYFQLSIPQQGVRVKPRGR